MRWIPCVTLYYLLSTQLCGTWGGPGPTGLYLPRLLKGQLSSLRSKLETKTGGSLKKEEILYRPTLGSGSKVAVLVAQSCPTLCDPIGWWPARLLCPWDSPGKNTGVGFHSLLRRVFPTQGRNPGLLHWQVDSLPSQPQGRSEEEG